MKMILRVLLLSSISIKSFAFNPNTNPFGIGLVLGQPTGLTTKYWIDKYYAIDAAAGFTLGSANSMHIHTDLLYHLYDVINIPQGEMLYYFGGGIRVKFADNDSTKFKNRKTRTGLRLVAAGLNYSFPDFETFPFNLFTEFVPVIDIAPKVRVDFNYGIGGRVYF